MLTHSTVPPEEKIDNLFTHSISFVLVLFERRRNNQRRYQRSVGDFRCEASAGRLADTRQDLLHVLAHDQGAGVQHAPARRDSREKYSSGGL